MRPSHIADDHTASNALTKSDQDVMIVLITLRRRTRRRRRRRRRRTRTRRRRVNMVGNSFGRINNLGNIQLCAVGNFLKSDLFNCREALLILANKHLQKITVLTF